MTRVAIVAGVAWLALALGSAVHAAPLTLGLFAPSAPLNKPGIESAHMGIIIKENGKTFFRNASQLKMNTVDQPFETYVEIVRKNPTRMGMSFMRIREDVQWEIDGKPQHGKIKLSELK